MDTMSHTTNTTTTTTRPRAGRPPGTAPERETFSLREFDGADGLLLAAGEALLYRGGKVARRRTLRGELRGEDRDRLSGTGLPALCARLFPEETFCLATPLGIEEVVARIGTGQQSSGEDFEADADLALSVLYEPALEESFDGELELVLVPASRSGGPEIARASFFEWRTSPQPPGHAFGPSRRRRSGSPGGSPGGSLAAPTRPRRAELPSFSHRRAHEEASRAGARHERTVDIRLPKRLGDLSHGDDGVLKSRLARIVGELVRLYVESGGRTTSYRAGPIDNLFLGAEAGAEAAQPVAAGDDVVVRSL